MAGSSVSSDAQHRALLVLLQLIAVAAICVSFFATGRSASGFALARYDNVRIGVLGSHGCAKSGPCWGATGQASYFHSFLLISHATALGCAGMSPYHLLITRRNLRHNAKARLIGLLTTAASLAMSGGILLLLNTTGFDSIEPGVAFAFGATVAEIVCFGALITLWMISPPASAETKHGTAKLNKEELAKQYGHGWWQRQHSAVVPPPEKRRQEQSTKREDEDRSSSDRKAIDPSVAYGHNPNRLTLGQMVPPAKKRRRLSALTRAFTTRASKKLPVKVKPAPQPVTEAPKPTFLEPPSIEPGFMPAPAPTRVIQPEDLWEAATQTTSVFADAAEVDAPEESDMPERHPSILQPTRRQRPSQPMKREDAPVEGVWQAPEPAQSVAKKEEEESDSESDGDDSLGGEKSAAAINKQLPPRPKWFADKSQPQAVKRVPPSPSMIERIPQWLKPRAAEPAKPVVVPVAVPPPATLRPANAFRPRQQSSSLKQKPGQVRTTSAEKGAPLFAAQRLPSGPADVTGQSQRLHRPMVQPTVAITPVPRPPPEARLANPYSAAPPTPKSLTQKMGDLFAAVSKPVFDEEMAKKQPSTVRLATKPSVPIQTSIQRPRHDSSHLRRAKTRQNEPARPPAAPQASPPVIATTQQQRQVEKLGPGLGERAQENLKTFANAVGVFGKRVLDSARRPVSPGRPAPSSPAQPTMVSRLQSVLSRDRGPPSPSAQTGGPQQSALSRFVPSLGRRTQAATVGGQQVSPKHRNHAASEDEAGSPAQASPLSRFMPAFLRRSDKSDDLERGTTASSTRPSGLTARQPTVAGSQRSVPRPPPSHRSATAPAPTVTRSQAIQPAPTRSATAQTGLSRAKMTQPVKAESKAASKQRTTTRKTEAL